MHAHNKKDNKYRTKKKARLKMSVSLKCENPLCTALLRLPNQLSHESGLFIRAEVLASDHESSSVKYFCPDLADSKKRLENVLHQLAKDEHRTAAFLSQADSMTFDATSSCYDKYCDLRKPARRGALKHANWDAL